ncbi:MAG: hypothetical protein NTY38_24415 [Acidobacteria bacterium]|nr:hypothetical protein [Acidobacteriota bacterium]
MNWIVITGSYPPDHGGVSHYTEHLARELARAGDRVWVFTGQGAEVEGSGRLSVVRLPNQFGPRALWELNRRIAEIPEPRRIFVQYIPQALGPNVSLRRNRFVGIPLSFCLWLQSRREEVWVMFHELRADVLPESPLPVKLLGSITRWMVRLVMRKCTRAFLSVPRWEREIREDVENPCPMEWLPIPSNLPARVEPSMVTAVRRRVLDEEPDLLLGHFGTFKAAMTNLFEGLLPELLAKPRRKMLLIGQNSTVYREHLIARYPQLEGVVVATGDLSLEDAAASIAACDLMLQPFPDGASSRRSSLMAPLALGRAIVTNLGCWSEPIWAKAGCVDITDFSDRAAALRRIESLIARPERRRALGERASQVYDERFSWQKTVRTLTQGALREQKAPSTVSGAARPIDYAIAGD